MASVQVRKNSWLNFADLLESDGIAFWDTADFPQITPQSGDTFVTVTDLNVGNLDVIAYKAYGDVDLWWVIAEANNIDLWPTDVLLNTKLRIPSKSFVDSLISRGGLK